VLTGKDAPPQGRAVPLDPTRIGKPRRRSKNMGSGGACPHHGRKGKAPSGAEGVPPSTAVDRRRRGLHRGHRPQAARLLELANSQRKRWGIEQRKRGRRGQPAVAGGAPAGEVLARSAPSSCPARERKRSAGQCILHRRRRAGLRPSPAARRPRESSASSSRHG
jgi:hypothetical protein